MTTTFVVAVFDLPQVLAETTGSETTRYLYGYGLLAEEGSVWAWHLGDGLGSVRQLAGGSGAITLAQGYTPFGLPLWSQGNAETAYGFTGEQWEADAQLVFLRARYYQPATGRFLSRDPFPGFAFAPTTQQPYVYVGNNPLRYVDPTGLDRYPGGPNEWSNYPPILPPSRSARERAEIERMLQEIGDTPTGASGVLLMRDQGYRVRYGNPIGGGAFTYPWRVITFKRGYPYDKTRSWLAHEIGHVAFMSEHGVLLCDSIEQEYEATRFEVLVQRDLGTLLPARERLWFGEEHDKQQWFLDAKWDHPWNFFTLPMWQPTNPVADLYWAYWQAIGSVFWIFD